MPKGLKVRPADVIGNVTKVARIAGVVSLKIEHLDSGLREVTTRLKFHA
jgi:hypothetical protein